MRDNINYKLVWLKPLCYQTTLFYSHNNNIISDIRYASPTISVKNLTGHFPNPFISIVNKHILCILNTYILLK